MREPTYSQIELACRAHNDFDNLGPVTDRQRAAMKVALMQAQTVDGPVYNEFFAGYSSGGVTFMCKTTKERDTISNWHFLATQRLPYFEAAYNKMRKALA